MRKVRVGVAMGLAVVVSAGLWSCMGPGPGESGKDVDWARQWAGCCGQRMVVEGDAHQFEMKDGLTVTGEKIPAGYEAEVWGQGLVVIARLPAGRYTVEVAGSENVFQEAEARVFDVSVDGETIQNGVDLYKLTGGTGRPYAVKGVVDHGGGVMKIVLRATRNNAKFSAIRVMDAAGDKVAWALAVDLKGIEKVLNDRAPVVHGPVVWRDWTKSTDVRLADLLRRMTLREKVGQMQNSAPELKRLGLPAYDYWNECLHGVARAGNATVFPQAIGMGASWDAPELHAVADVISTEARAKHEDAIRNGNFDRYYGLTFWTPNINIFRDPRWGRGQETYGEDPFLTGKMGVAFITGLQGFGWNGKPMPEGGYYKVMATAKHYAVHSGPEVLRHIFDATPPERDFYEEYLPQFEMAVREGHVESVMGAYNDVYGKPACGSDLLLTKILREEWGFNGYVVSDCGAISDIWWNHHAVATRAEASAMAVKAGCDLECGGDYSALASAVDMGLISEKEVDVALGRILTARFKLGMFDPPERVKWAQIPISENDSAAHNALALEMAHKSMVLLKNEGGVLPLRKDMKKIAVVGPNADSLLPLLGNYFGTPSRPVMVLDGIKAEVPGTEVVYVRGCDIGVRKDGPELVPDVCLQFGGATGLRGEYFDNDSLSGVPVAVRQDRAIDFNGWMDRTMGGVPVGGTAVAKKRGGGKGEKAAKEGAAGKGAVAAVRKDAGKTAAATTAEGETETKPEPVTKDFSVRWVGEFVAPADGTYELNADGASAYRLFLGGKLVQDTWTGGGGLAGPGATNTVTLKAGEAVALELDCRGEAGVLNIELTWNKQYGDIDLAPLVLEKIKGAEAVIFVGGLDGRIEQEEGTMRAPIDGFLNGDRLSIELPKPQTDLMKALAGSGVPLVYVNMTGSAVAVPWEKEHVPAILQAWYPGQMGGKAVADVLFGEYNPAGRLPVTFYGATEDLPSFMDYSMNGPAIGGKEMGRTYRHFTGKPLWAFGHGLSYTTFTYGTAAVDTAEASAEDTVQVGVDVTNGGERDGEEVVQVYAREGAPKGGDAIRKLVSFKRVAIGAGKTAHVELPVRMWDLRVWNEATQGYGVEAGAWELEVGAASDDLRGRCEVQVK